MTSYQLPSLFSYYGAVLILCLCVYAIGINLIALLTFFLSPSLKEAPQNFIFLSILCCSLIASIQVIVMHSQLFMTNSWSHLNNCSVHGFLLQTVATTQTFILLVLALDRYYAMTKGNPFSKKMLFILLSSGILSIILFYLVPFMIPNWGYVTAPSKIYCISNFASPEMFPLNLVMILFGLFVVVFILVIYVRIYLVFKKVSRRRKVSLVMTNALTSTPDKESADKEYKIWVTSLTLTTWTVVGNL
jgi:hypothetical protein